VLDKENAAARKGIFMIDASKGFRKDGNKNRLREQDIHRIVDTFTGLKEIPGYSRMVPLSEISDPKNNYNLNLPRYIDSTEPEDLQDIDGHLRGGIPDRDIDALDPYWQVLPSVRPLLFKSAGRPGYSVLKLPAGDVKAAVLGHPEFVAYSATVTALFDKWKKANAPRLLGIAVGDKPKALIETLAEAMLATFGKARLLDPYDLYQHLMDYWAATMQDDCYLIAVDGWKAETYRVIETDKKGKEKDKGWACDLIPKPLIVARYYAMEQAAIDQLAAELESVAARLAELEEEHGGDDGAFSELEKVNKANVAARLKEIKGDKEAKDEAAVLNAWLKLNADEADLKKRLKDFDADLDARRPTPSTPSSPRPRSRHWWWTTSGWPAWRPPYRASSTASRRPSPAAFVSWLIATPRRCRRSPRMWRGSPLESTTTSRRWGRHGSETRIQADGGGGISPRVGH